jgi:hypothetical protein
MKAVFLADEADVHAMTEDAKIAMKKPHRTVFVKEWLALRKTGVYTHTHTHTNVLCRMLTCALLAAGMLTYADVC